MDAAIFTFYGGVNEIGGNKILLEDGKVKMFFDFGQFFTIREGLFISSFESRWICGLKDYFQFNIIPKIRGLYGEKQLVYTDLRYSSR